MNMNEIASKIENIERDLLIIEKDVTKIYNKENENSIKIINIEHTISGVNGQNGLQQDVRDMKNDNKETKANLDNIIRTLTYYKGMAIALQLLGAAVTTLLGLLANFLTK
jgi:hypothetical protein